MTKALSDIERLLPLLEMAFRAEQVKMAKINARIGALNVQMDELDRPRSKSDLSAATRAGADLFWSNWAQQRKILINQEIALAAQEREHVRASVAAALSKLEAARQVHSRALFDEKRLQSKRAME